MQIFQYLVKTNVYGETKSIILIQAVENYCVFDDPGQTFVFLPTLGQSGNTDEEQPNCNFVFQIKQIYYLYYHIVLHFRSNILRN